MFIISLLGAFIIISLTKLGGRVLYSDNKFVKFSNLFAVGSSPNNKRYVTSSKPKRFSSKKPLTISSISIPR